MKLVVTIFEQSADKAIEAIRGLRLDHDMVELRVDPFHGGATLTMSEIATMISGISGGQVRLTSEHLRAWTPRQTLVRVLANLQNMWGRVGEGRKAQAAAERAELLQGKVRER